MNTSGELGKFRGDERYMGLIQDRLRVLASALEIAEKSLEPQEEIELSNVLPDEPVTPEISPSPVSEATPPPIPTGDEHIIYLRDQIAMIHDDLEKAA